MVEGLLVLLLRLRELRFQRGQLLELGRGRLDGLRVAALRLRLLALWCGG